MRLIHLRRPSTTRLREFVAGQSPLELTYREVGASAGTDLPAGYAHERDSVDLGPFTTQAFRQAAAALRSWRVHAGADLTVFPADPVTEGETFALVARLPAVGYATAAVRVVFMLDDPERSGFGYGTLPEHPEQGEEAFVIARSGDRMVFSVTAFSRPRHPLARFAAPVSRLLQRMITRRYIAAMRAVAGQIERTRPG